jgi:acrylyl-CoA reductase (NADPH)
MSEVNALVAHLDAEGSITLQHEVVDTSFLPEGDVQIAVEYSGINYKDALAITPKGGVAREYPLIPGIDVAGTVTSSSSSDFSVGDRVVAHGYDIGTGRHGGYADTARYPADFLVKLDELTTAEAAAIGTAGFTAAMSVNAIRAAGVQPADGPILVTGATGGVGSVSVDLLAGLGYEVVASTGKSDAHDWLMALGATQVIGRLPTEGEKVRALGKSQWAGVVDSVGGDTLAYALSTLNYGGTAAISGLARSADLPTTVMPFILRGVSLLGVDSVMCPAPVRAEAWRRLGTDLPTDLLDAMTTVEPLSKVPELAEQILAGQTRGRVVIDTSA